MNAGQVMATIMRHEWRIMTRSRIWQSVAALFVASSALGTYNGMTWARAQRDSYRARTEEQIRLVSGFKSEQARYEQAVLKSGDAKPPSASRFLTLGIKGTKVMLPLSPLAALAVGQADIYSVSAAVNMYNHASDLFTEVDLENPLNLLSGTFDMAFVLVYIFPLLILAVSYNLISSERERGILAAALSQPVSLWQLVSAKIALRAAFLCGLAIVCSVAAAALSGADLSAGDVLLRVLLWSATVVLYAGWWFAVALAVNAFGRSSAANATLLATAWALFVLIIPAFLGLAVTYVHPVPSRLELTQAGRRAGIQAEQIGRALIASYYAEHPEFASGAQSPAFTDDARMFYAVHAKVERHIEPLVARLNAQLANQQQLVTWCRFASPVIVAQEALNDIAGTGTSRFARFREQAAAFHSEWQEFFISKVFRGTRMTAADYDAHPQFVFHDEDARPAASRAVAGLAGLSIPALLAGALAAGVLRKYPILPA